MVKAAGFGLPPNHSSSNSHFPSLPSDANLTDPRRLLADLPHPINPVPPGLPRRQCQPLGLEHRHGQIPREHWRICLAQNVHHGAQQFAPPE